MEPIKDILPDVIKSLSQRKIQDDGKVDRIWKQILGQDARFSEVLGVNEGILTIKVDKSMRAYTYKMRARQFLKKLQEEIPEIKQIIFRT